jgi:hypothetical protein
MGVSAGANRAHFTVPFIGLYAVLTKGSFFADIIVRQDALDLRVTNPVLLTPPNTALNGSGTNVTSSAGYHTDFNNFFVEPSMALSYTHIRFAEIAAPALVAGQQLQTQCWG